MHFNLDGIRICISPVSIHRLCCRQTHNEILKYILNRHDNHCHNIIISNVPFIIHLVRIGVPVPRRFLLSIYFPLFLIKCGVMCSQSTMWVWACSIHSHKWIYFYKCKWNKSRGVCVCQIASSQSKEVFGMGFCIVCCAHVFILSRGRVGRRDRDESRE